MSISNITEACPSRVAYGLYFTYARRGADLENLAADGPPLLGDARRLPVPAQPTPFPIHHRSALIELEQRMTCGDRWSSEVRPLWMAALLQLA